MHLIESQALNTGLKINKPYIYESYVPLGQDVDKYITIQPYGAHDARQYSYWLEVLDTLLPLLDKENIKVVQIGVGNEPELPGCVDMRAKTSINQAAYLIKNSLLHLGVDSFGVHVASGYDKKIVALYSNMLPSQSGPYWSNEKDIILLEPERKDSKPSYTAFEFPKTINRIRPEQITRSVAKLLNIKFEFPYDTLHIGKEYESKKVELHPDSYLTNWSELGVDSLIVRMDLEFNEGNLIKQLRLTKCSLVTDRPINLQIIQALKENILEFVFFIDLNTDIDYFSQLRKIGINPILISRQSTEELNKIKLKYIEIGRILHRPKGSRDKIKKLLKGKDPKKLFYKSSRLTVKGESLYTSLAEIKNGSPVTRTRSIDPKPIIDTPEFWEDLNSLLILEKTS